MPLWNSRFRKPLDKRALKFSSSIEVDKRLFNDDIDGSKAHVQMLVQQKIIPAGDGKVIVRALEQIRKEIASGKLRMDWRDEDIHTFIEERLVKKIGSRGKWLHTARSRNDQIALDERLYLRREITNIVSLVREFQLSLLAKAQEHKNTIVPGYTHLQRAQPILFAHHLLAYVSMLQRDKERFNDCSKRANWSPLGAAAFAGTSLPIDRNWVAGTLGLSGIVRNSIDAVSDRDVLIECVSACSIAMMHMSRFAEEMILWSSHEFGFATFDDTFATGSSLMPQKKNPDMAELIRGKTGRVYGSVMGLLTIMKGLPLAYNRDMQEDKVHLFDAIDTTKECLSMSADLLSQTTFKADRFEKELLGDLSLSTDLADYLVRKGVPFREAHLLVGQVVAMCADRDCKLHELPLSSYKQVSGHFANDVLDLSSPRRSVEVKRSEGGTSFREIASQIRYWKRTLKNVQK